MRKQLALALAAGSVSVLLLAGCSSKTNPSAGAQKAPAKVENRVAEANLTRITLTPEAEKRLGIEVADVTEGRATGVMTIAGEIMLIPGKAITATAPVAGVVHLTQASFSAGQNVRKGEPLFRLTPILGPQRDLRVTYEADVTNAKARLDNASQQLARARQLLRDLAGSQKNVDAAEQEFGQAKAAYDAAVQRLDWFRAHPYEGDQDMTIPSPETGIVRQIQASNGQTVSAGAVLVEVADLSRVWLRVPVYAGDTDAVRLPSRVTVRDVDGAGPVREGIRVAAPPTADPIAVTTDVYYELTNLNRDLSPGRRMSVILPAAAAERRSLVVPASALTYDIHGGTWVYVADGSHTYRRQRVELIQTERQQAFLSRGVSAGVKVVKTGVAELFGTEFGAGK